MIDNKFALPVPYIVSAVFSDGQRHQQLLKTVRAHSDAEAAGGTISQFYLEGGKLPLLLVHVMQIEEQTARAAVATFEEIAAANKAEEAKVSPFHVGNPFNPPDPILGGPPPPDVLA